ncbi:MAG: RNA polymerase sigma factor [Rhodospirillaceae bacterium]|nr:RNA polymerase sigma factor [Rhodospirillaceae bacterium]
MQEGDQSTYGSEAELVRQLRARDRAAFTGVVEAYHAGLVRFAQTFLQSKASAEEIAQETWLAVIEGIGRFEGRASLKSWIYSIVANKAKTRAVRERRMLNFTDLSEQPSDSGDGIESRFTSAGMWKDKPIPWDGIDPERIVSGQELWRHGLTLVDELPPGQRAVVLLRDVEGHDAAEVCDILGISEANQRVLLHRARSKLRAAFDQLLGTKN